MVALLLFATIAAAQAATSDPSAIRVLSADGAPVALELLPSGGPQAGRVKAANPGTERMPNLYQVPARCRDVPYRVVDQYGRPMATRLGDLPNAGALQLLVDRKLDGCRVITVKQGLVARDEPNPPPQSYRIRPLKP